MRNDEEAFQTQHFRFLILLMVVAGIGSEFSNNGLHLLTMIGDFSNQLSSDCLHLALLRCLLLNVLAQIMRIKGQ